MRWLALMLVAACYSPHPQSGAKCAADGTCPEGLDCVATPQGSVCAPPGTVFPDAPAIHDAPDYDAPVDSRLADARVWMDAPAANGPMLVQQMTNSVQSGSTVSATFAATPTAGNLLVMVGAANGGMVDSVTGAATWTSAAGNFDNANVEIWYGYATSGSTVTLTRAVNTNNIWVQISEWSNMAATAPLDKASAASGLNGTAAAPSITTLHAHDVLIFGVASQKPATVGSTPSPGTWTAMSTVQTIDNIQNVWFEEVAAAGTYLPTVSDNSTGGGWDAAVAAFKAAN